jgi:hypothetical protein
MLRSALVSLSMIAALAVPASADDEASEQTAELMGEAADTLGVTVAFDAKAGWSMRVRPAPGETEQTYTLAALGKQHAHYVVYVAPGRSKITFVEVSHGMRDPKDIPRASSTLAWTYSPKGRLLYKTSYGQVFSATERGKFLQSVSHVRWTEMPHVTDQGLAIKVADSKRTVVVDARTGKLR